MGTVISLERHRNARLTRVNGAGRSRAPATLFFELGSPYTYLAAERAERLFSGLRWQPASVDALAGGEFDDGAMRHAAERAALLGLPLAWPDEPYRPRGAIRVAALAAERGCGAAFVLAASRLAFCGGFDIDEPDILAEAAAAAGIGLGEALGAVGDVRRDVPIEAAGRMLLAAGASCLPAVRVGAALFCGEERLVEAAAAARAAGRPDARLPA